MKIQSDTVLKTRVDNGASRAPELPESGIVLVDRSFKPIASDPGAMRLFNGSRGRSAHSNGEVSVADAILAEIRSREPADVSCRTTSVSIGTSRYRCRSYVIQSDNPGFTPAILAIHFETCVAAVDPIREIAAEYHLTDREEQALRGIALGLSTKELAERMTISPNTVKAYVRLIMIKLGVTTRTAIIGKLLVPVDTKR